MTLTHALPAYVAERGRRPISVLGPACSRDHSTHTATKIELKCLSQHELAKIRVRVEQKRQESNYRPGD
jgi:hypothetical protein